MGSIRKRKKAKISKPTTAQKDNFIVKYKDLVWILDDKSCFTQDQLLAYAITTPLRIIR